YVGANVDLGRKVGITDYPVHFSPTESLPMPPPVSPTPGVPGTISDGWKRTFLVKYTSNGQFDWKRALQGDVSSSLDRSNVLDVLVDSKDDIHFIAGFTSGIHLDNK